MSADNYWLVIKGNDGLFRIHMMFASDYHERLGRVHYEAGSLEEAVRWCQLPENSTEYGYYIRGLGQWNDHQT